MTDAITARKGGQSEGDRLGDCYFIYHLLIGSNGAGQADRKVSALKGKVRVSLFLSEWQNVT